MKKYLISITLLITAINVLGQSTKELDNRNGFKSIKIDDLKTKYSSGLTFWKSISEDNVTGYLYTSTDNSLFYVFDLKADAIKLFFDNTTNKLVRISLVKTYPASESSNHYSTALADNKSLIDNFTTLFGRYSGKIDDEKNGDIGVGWVGDKVILKVITTYEGLSNGSYNEISISKLSFVKSKVESGF